MPTLRHPPARRGRLTRDRRPAARLASGALQALGWPALGLLAYARFGTRPRHWVVELVDTWVPYLLSPFPLLLGPAALLRSHGLAALAGLGSGFWLAALRGELGRGAGAPGPRDLRVLSANVLGTNPRPDEFAALVWREGPDVVAVQELRTGFAAGLNGELAERYPYRVFEPHARYSGAGLLSRLPLKEVEPLRLSDQGHLCQRARLCTPRGEITLLNVHLETPWELAPRPGKFPAFWPRRRAGEKRDEEIERLLELVVAEPGPVIVVGDFNSAAGSRPYRRLRAGLQDAFLEAGCGFVHTWPRRGAVQHVPFPALLRIDYVWYAGSLAPVALRAAELRGSDHLALIADFRVCLQSRVPVTPL